MYIHEPLHLCSCINTSCLVNCVNSYKVSVNIMWDPLKNVHSKTTLFTSNNKITKKCTCNKMCKISLWALTSRITYNHVDYASHIRIECSLFPENIIKKPFVFKSYNFTWRTRVLLMMHIPVVTHSSGSSWLCTRPHESACSRSLKLKIPCSSVVFLWPDQGLILFECGLLPLIYVACCFRSNFVHTCTSTRLYWLRLVKPVLHPGPPLSVRYLILVSPCIFN